MKLLIHLEFLVACKGLPLTVIFWRDTIYEIVYRSSRNLTEVLFNAFQREKTFITFPHIFSLRFWRLFTDSSQDFLRPFLIILGAKFFLKAFHGQKTFLGGVANLLEIEEILKIFFRPSSEDLLKKGRLKSSFLDWILPRSSIG